MSKQMSVVDGVINQGKFGQKIT